MRRREFLALMGAGAAGLLAGDLLSAEAAGSRPRPNIVVILADDLGYADLGCHGETQIPTPHIDSIARSGVRFTNGYVSCPVCSPTRAGLLTGRYQQRFGHEFNPWPWVPPEKLGLPLSEITLADLLRQAGYATGVVGKWHLGQVDHFHPFRRGFDEFFGFLGGGHSYLDAKAQPRNPILRGTEPVDEKDYLTDAFSREAVAFIERHRSRPFFLYLAYNAVHTPMHATEKYLRRFPGIANKGRRTYAAMLSAMDDGIGALLGKLRQRGLTDDTLVFFLSDNGGPVVSSSSNLPLRAQKATVYEGGIRVPFLLQWPRRLPRGEVCDDPVISLDILPTALAAAGASLPEGGKIDGLDLLPYLTEENKGRPHESLYWRQGPRAAIRKGDWKLVRVEGKPIELYNLAADVSETNSLAREEPDQVAQLSRALASWECGLAPPLWTPTPAPPRQPPARQRANP
jgi:arylsulfatase A-like enzyme